MSNLSANLSKAPIARFSNVDLTQEWRAIERMVAAGIIPWAERIKEYIQASCAKDALNDIDKVILCISDILRQEEENCSSTDPVLRDILVVLESGSSTSALKSIFVGISS